MTMMMSLYGLSVWLPSVARSFGPRSDAAIGLLVAVPYCAAAAGMIIAAQHSDRTGERRWHVSIALVVGGLGMALSGQMPNLALTLLVLCVAALGLWSSFGPFWALPTSF